MKLYNKPVYQCEYCLKIYKIKRYCLSHERHCRKNPANIHPCFGGGLGCKHCNQTRVKGDELYTYWCETKKEHMYSNRLYGQTLRELQEWYKECIDEGNLVVMPIKCNHYCDGVVMTYSQNQKNDNDPF